LVFAESCNECHRPTLYVIFNYVFAYLPLAVRLHDDVACLHGGLGPQFVSLDQLKAPYPPITASTDPIFEAIVWPDPNADAADFQPNQKRNRGSEFGERPLGDFLSCHGLKTPVRSQSFVLEDVHFAFDNRIVAVSGAFNCCEGTNELLASFS
jgi:hypothetical protein